MREYINTCWRIFFLLINKIQIIGVHFTKDSAANISIYVYLGSVRKAEDTLSAYMDL